MADIPPQSDADLIDFAYPCALDAVADIERRRIDARLAGADPAVRQAFSDTVWQVRDIMGRLTVLDECVPPPGLEDRILAALPDRRAGKRVVRASSWRGPLWWAVPIATLVCLMFGAWRMTSRGTGSPPDRMALH
ncbi:RskA family anti-sigma factor [Nocardia sp. 004]|uniref:RskA family anti-sigma factor n=1 Tax=Nocardia sp. 004 TaxID=3385978 RepID=UPI0039A2FA5E